MEHSIDILLEERTAIETEIEHLKQLQTNHYNQINRLKREQVSYEIKRREVDQTLTLISQNNPS